MALLVDPPQRDSAAERPAEVPVDAQTADSAAAGTMTAGTMTVGTMTVGTVAEGTAAGVAMTVVPVAASDAAITAEPADADVLADPEALADPVAEAAPPRLAEPPISGGYVEVLMGRLIKVLSHSALAQPLPAVILSALGLGGVAFVGLCATAPRPSVATPPVLLPLTYVVRALGAPHLPDLVANVLMYVSIALCCVGLAMMLWANSRGWQPNPRKVFLTAAGAIAVLVNITPVGSSDVASYAAYGRIAALGRNPYVYLPSQLPGWRHNAFTMIVGTNWQSTPSVYGPVATWTQLAAAWLGGQRAWLTIWILMIMMGAAFIATGYVLLRSAANPVRAVLLWTANPLLIVELVMGGHLDTILALAAIGAIVLSRRGTTIWHDVGVALLVGVAGGIKINAAFVALGVMIPLIHDRAWARLGRICAISGATVLALYYFSYGLVALKPLGNASSMVISPTLWRLAQVSVQHYFGKSAEHTVTSAFGFIWPALMLLLAWYLYNRLSPDVPTVVAASCALTFAWMVVAPWQLPWYSSIAWVAVALLPRNSLTRWLTLATGILSFMHFNGGHPTHGPLGPTP